MARLVNIDGVPPPSSLLPDWIRVWSEPERAPEPPTLPMIIFEIVHRPDTGQDTGQDTWQGSWEVRRDRRFHAGYLRERYARDEVEREIAAIRLAGGKAGLYDRLS